MNFHIFYVILLENKEDEKSVANIYVPAGLPAAAQLREEGVNITDASRPSDVKAKRILLLNLMPLKEATERQLFRLFSESEENIEFTLMKTFSYTSKNTSAEHLDKFYHSFEEPFIKDSYFDGLIVTGAPVEQLKFDQVVYWEELCHIFEWAKTHIKGIYSICWGAQAALKILYGTEKYLTKDKLFGIYGVGLTEDGKSCPLCKDMPEKFITPQSRYAYVKREDIQNDPALRILAEGEEAGIHMAASKDLKLVCVFGHPEYDKETLSGEYFRDLNRGDDIVFPHNYFVDDNPLLLPDPTWQSVGRSFAAKWINML